MFTDGVFMANIKAFISQVYSAFNQRDIGGALLLMSESVSWPKASEGGRVVGKEEIRAYWMRQWKRVIIESSPLAPRFIIGSAIPGSLSGLFPPFRY
jgi:hypothetical protein